MKGKLNSLVQIKNRYDFKNNKVTEIEMRTSKNNKEIIHCTNELNSKIFSRKNSNDILYFDMKERENFFRYDPTELAFNELIVMYSCKKEDEKVSELLKEKSKYKMNKKHYESNIFGCLSTKL